MLPLPTLYHFVAEEHGNGKRGFTIRRHVEHILSSRRAFALSGPLAFIEILVDVSALGRMGFLPQHFRRSRERNFLFSKPVEHGFRILVPCASQTQPDWAPRALPALRAGCRPSGSRRKRHRSDGSDSGPLPVELLPL